MAIAVVLGIPQQCQWYKTYSKTPHTEVLLTLTFLEPNLTQLFSMCLIDSIDSQDCQSGRQRVMTILST